MSRPGGLQLSPVQIVASLLATLTGAFLASYLGVGGTLAGAALGSIASTTGTEVYRHYLRRSQERLKAAGEVLRQRQQTGQHAQHTQPAGAQSRGAAGLGDAATETLAASRAARSAAGARYNGRGPDTSPDATETQIIPAVTEASAGPRQAGPAGHTASEHATGELSDGAAPDGSGGSGGPWWRHVSRRQWLIYGGVTLGVFLIGMVVITIIELSAGKPLDAAVWGKHSTGTSVGSVVGGGHGANQQPTPHTSSTPGTQSSSTAPGSSPAATPSGTAPSPTTSASTVPSSSPAATPTPGTGAGSAQAVTPTP